MNKLFRIIFLFSLTAGTGLAGTSLFAQYQGGSGDGKANVDFLTSISPSIHCLGGSDDGFGWLTVSGAISPGICYEGGTGDGSSEAYTLSAMAPAIYLAGGNNDGMAYTGTSSPVSAPIYCFGGDHDGSGVTGFLGTANGQVIYCLGGAQDGAGRISAMGTISPALYCSGGSGDGQHLVEVSSFALGLGVWSGYISSNWNNAGNWTNNTVPGIGNKVVVPGNCIHYPVVNSNFSVNDINWGETRCEQLDILSGAILTTTHEVRINGLVTIQGQTRHTNPSQGSISIQSGGNLVVKSGGSILAEP